MYELTLYFKSGNQIKVQCSSYRFEFLSSNYEFSGYSIEGSNPKVSFQPKQLEAYTALEIK